MDNFLLEKLDPDLNSPLIFIILDGVGIYRGLKDGYPGNAFDLANAPVIKNLMKTAPLYTELKAHGTSVGMPSDEDMGNSEVGHNAMGAGRIFDQGAKLVSESIDSGRLFQGEAWMELIGTKEKPGLALDGKDRTVHFLGLLSDGNVHSHISHLLSMLKNCKSQGVKRVCVHTLLDGRDVPETSALIYINQLEETLAELDPERNNYFIASGGGRMTITMDRYEADWDMVRLGWETHVAGRGRMFPSAAKAIETYREENPDMIDQDLSPFVIEKDGKPAGPIKDGDIVIYFNFRGDRAIEISRIFTEESFTKCERNPFVRVHYAGMMEYDGDLKIPPRYLVNPPAINHTISEYLVKNGVKQYAISETQKFGHVTYFWNGNNSEKFDAKLEIWKEIPSDKISFDKKPEMKAREVTEEMIQAMESDSYRFIRVNFANGDMVGHTGVLDASVKAIEVLDECVKKILAVAEKHRATVVITADHGNCDMMIEVDKKTQSAVKNKDGRYVSKTSHTLNPVPFILTGENAEKFKINPDAPEPGLGNIASTIITLLGYRPPSIYLPSIVVKK